ncbi:TetR/AcrR family transcriptional regulator [Brevundimonas sp. A19_0]|uniref:TetR/AcrR family transcriptional regulator n=1 Tax=Brevundimonas sp. A19_0 TaxID=2821087 RepID=UPI001ADA0B36|nr:TetR/AcrR family transcriptional regulator [Brevundimonas sp. A19_0]MBO9502899.1 TetR/AcrR family transcriptional regulator [Brevundimonas sp. A19_0]
MRDTVVNPTPANSEAGSRPLNRRQVAKQRTRGKVIEASRRLFAQRGYDAATIRDIAREAGMSTGAVFANFQDKAELFDTVLAEDIDALTLALAGGIKSGSDVTSRLLGGLTAGYEATLDQLPLVQAVVARAWHQPLEDARKGREVLAPVTSQIEDVVAAAVKAGELKAGTDAALVSELVWIAYLANYRRAAYDGWTVEQLKSHLGNQVDMILAGQLSR